LQERDWIIRSIIEIRDWHAVLMELTNGRVLNWLSIIPLGGKKLGEELPRVAHHGPDGNVWHVGRVCLRNSPVRLRALKAIAQMPRFNPIRLINRNRGVFGLNLGQMWGRRREGCRSGRAKSCAVSEAGWVRPHVDSHFFFRTQSLMPTVIWKRKNTGKVVLVPLANIFPVSL
jgi:hypothetical protein